LSNRHSSIQQYAFNDDRRRSEEPFVRFECRRRRGTKADPFGAAGQHGMKSKVNLSPSSCSQSSFFVLPSPAAMPLPKLLLMALVVLGLGAPLQGSAQLTKLQYGACDSDLDCVLLGTCVDGKCQCNEGWTGANCEQIDLIPRDSLDGFDDPYYPAWG
jgi:hypothetical protein